MGKEKTGERNESKRKYFEKNSEKSVSIRKLCYFCALCGIFDAFKPVWQQQCPIKEGDVRVGAGTAGAVYFLSSGFSMETSGGMCAAFVSALLYLFFYGKEESKDHLAFRSVFAFLYYSVF